MLEFNQYMIQVKCYTLSFLILNFKLEKSMRVQITQKIVQQQKYGIIFLVNIQCHHFGNLGITLKVNLLYIEEKTV